MQRARLLLLLLLLVLVPRSLAVTAEAGEDVKISCSGSPLERVILDASASVDAQDFKWSSYRRTSVGKRTDMYFPPGTHTVLLTAFDADGSPAYDTMTVWIGPPCQQSTPRALSVAFVHQLADQAARDVVTSLTSLDPLIEVKVLPQGASDGDARPMLNMQTLALFDVVLIAQDAGPWAHPIQLGDLLARYVSAGGHVVRFGVLQHWADASTIRGTYGDAQFDPVYIWPDARVYDPSVPEAWPGGFPTFVPLTDTVLHPLLQYVNPLDFDAGWRARHTLRSTLINDSVYWPPRRLANWATPECLQGNGCEVFAAVRELRNYYTGSAGRSTDNVNLPPTSSPPPAGVGAPLPPGALHIPRAPPRPDDMASRAPGDEDTDVVSRLVSVNAYPVSGAYFDGFWKSGMDRLLAAALRFAVTGAADDGLPCLPGCDFSQNRECMPELATCQCQAGWVGEHCDKTPLEQCQLDCPSDRGRCNVETAECECKSPWVGPTCACDASCELNGVCTDEGCQCVGPWMGDSCEEPWCKQGCDAPSVCVVSGDDWEDAQCRCPAMFHGDQCDMPGTTSLRVTKDSPGYTTLPMATLADNYDIASSPDDDDEQQPGYQLTVIARTPPGFNSQRYRIVLATRRSAFPVWRQDEKVFDRHVDGDEPLVFDLVPDAPTEFLCVFVVDLHDHAARSVMSSRGVAVVDNTTVVLEAQVSQTANPDPPEPKPSLLPAWVAFVSLLVVVSVLGVAGIVAWKFINVQPNGGDPSGSSRSGSRRRRRQPSPTTATPPPAPALEGVPTAPPAAAGVGTKTHFDNAVATPPAALRFQKIDYIDAPAATLPPPSYDDAVRGAAPHPHPLPATAFGLTSAAAVATLLPPADAPLQVVTLMPPGESPPPDMQATVPGFAAAAPQQLDGTGLYHVPMHTAPSPSMTSDAASSLATDASERPTKRQRLDVPGGELGGMSPASTAGGSDTLSREAIDEVIQQYECEALGSPDMPMVSPEQLDEILAVYSNSSSHASPILPSHDDPAVAAILNSVDEELRQRNALASDVMTAAAMTTAAATTTTTTTTTAAAAAAAAATDRMETPPLAGIDRSVSPAIMLTPPGGANVKVSANLTPFLSLFLEKSVDGRREHLPRVVASLCGMPSLPDVDPASLPQLNWPSKQRPKDDRHICIRSSTPKVADYFREYPPDSPEWRLLSPEQPLRWQIARRYCCRLQVRSENPLNDGFVRGAHGAANNIAHGYKTSDTLASRRWYTSVVVRIPDDASPPEYAGTWGTMRIGRFVYFLHNDNAIDSQGYQRAVVHYAYVPPIKQRKAKASPRAATSSTTSVVPSPCMVPARPPQPGEREAPPVQTTADGAAAAVAAAYRMDLDDVGVSAGVTCGVSAIAEVPVLDGSSPATDSATDPVTDLAGYLLNAAPPDAVPMRGVTTTGDPSLNLAVGLDALPQDQLVFAGDLRPADASPHSLSPGAPASVGAGSCCSDTNVLYTGLGDVNGAGIGTGSSSTTADGSIAAVLDLPDPQILKDLPTATPLWSQDAGA